MRHWLTIAALLVAAVAQGQFSTTLKTVLSGDNPILFEYHAGDSLAAATFTRASTATYRDVAGVLQTASSGVARDGHYAWDQVSGTYQQTLLLEGQRTNLFLRSQELDDAAWNKTGVTIVADDTTAPDGTATADKIVNAAATNLHMAWQAKTTTSGSVYTWSAFVKKGNLSFARLGFHDGSFHWGTFNLDTGAVATADAGLTLSIQSFPSGWYRISLTATINSTAPEIYVGFVPTDSNAAYLGAITENGYAWGAQVELGSFPSSYIPTTTATVSRAADSLSFPFTHPPQEMTVFARAIDAGIFSQSNIALVKLGTLGITSPYVLVYVSGANIVAYHSANSTSALGTAVGEAMECRAFMAANGNIQLGLSRNGAAETLSTTTSGPAIESSWNADVVRLNEWSGGVGFVAIRDLIIFKGIRDLTYFRARIAP